MMWNVSTGQTLQKFRGHAARVNCVCFNEESTVILSGSMDGTVKVWDLRSRRNNAIQVSGCDGMEPVSCLLLDVSSVMYCVAGKIKIYDFFVRHWMKRRIL